MSNWKQHKCASAGKWKSRLLWSSVMCCFSIYLLMVSGKESACQCRRCGLDPWVWKIPWRREWQPTPVFLPGKSHGQEELGRLLSTGLQESDTIEGQNKYAVLLLDKQKNYQYIWQQDWSSETLLWSLEETDIKQSLVYFFFLMFLFLAALGLCCCMGFCLGAVSGGHSLAAVHELIAVASLVEHRLQSAKASAAAARGLSSCSSEALELWLNSCGAQA